MNTYYLFTYNWIVVELFFIELFNEMTNHYFYIRSKRYDIEKLLIKCMSARSSSEKKNANDELNTFIN